MGCGLGSRRHQGTAVSIATLQRPDVESELRRLKDFQRTTAEYVHRRLYLDDDYARRFLVADEVGLGKTMVARGVIAQAIDHLWDDVDRIDIVYVCSNSAIARQNLNRLQLHLGSDQSYVSADRLTLLAETLPELTARKLNFISFTPGTSFELGRRAGTARERRLLYHLLHGAWDLRGMGPVNVFQGGVGRARWRQFVAEAPAHLEPSITNEFVSRVNTHHGLRERFEGLAERCRWRSNYGDAWPECVEIVAHLRRHLAASCLQALQPDLIILDEFQRFRSLLNHDEGNPAGQLASDMFMYQNEDGSEQARVLLLSATPYKMYTMSDEQSDDHYRDFISTLGFLEGSDDTRAVEELLADYRAQLYDLGSVGSDPTLSRAALEARLRRVMSRTERITATQERDGMLRQVSPTLKTTTEDVRRYAVLQRAADSLELQSGSVMPYWKSIPYPANFMDDYQFGSYLREAFVGPNGPQLLQDLSRARSFFPKREWQRYQAIDPANARLRALYEATIEPGAWRLLWLPPTAPYHALGLPFSDPALVRFTKRLLFSSWAATPKALAVLTSYEAERRMMREGDASAENTEQARNRIATPLQLRMDGEKPATMSLLTLLYPSATLAQELDPAMLGATVRSGSGNPGELPTLRRILSLAHGRAVELLSVLPAGPSDGPVDQAWYWAAPILLDAHFHRKPTEAWLEASATPALWGEATTGGSDDDPPRVWGRHVDEVRAALNGTRSLGRRPSDLASVITHIALAGPATVALRSLNQSSAPNGPEDLDAIRNAAGTLGFGLRSLFRTPEAQSLVRGSKRSSASEDIYWRRVLNYGIRGCLQAVMDEYIHVLAERLGVADPGSSKGLGEIVDAAREAIGLRTVPLRTTGISGRTGVGGQYATRIHFARRLGDDKADDEARGARIGRVQEAFNSPFWPFVLITTSIGQEGLDFHTYCHAVVHWDLPHNPVDMEQREGRVHRYKGHAVRKNIADRYAGAVLADPERAQQLWREMFQEARDQREHGANDLIPFWVYPGAAAIERHVSAYPMSRDITRLEALRRSLAIYRMVFGQPRQDDLLEYLAGRIPADQLADLSASWQIDLRPPQTHSEV
jgi:hypothetical protein